MTTAKHTPGPWVNEGFEGLIVNTNEGTMTIAHGDTLEKAKANARLIASAPALLEALEGLLANSPAPKGIKADYSYILYLEAAKKAIAQAKGGQS